MKKQGYTFLCMCILLAACQRKDTGEATAKENPLQEQIENIVIPKIIRLKPDDEAFIRQWEAYNRLEIEMQNFQKAPLETYNGIIEELIRLEKELSKSEFPEKLNIPAVKSRVLLFRTYLLQTKTSITTATKNTSAAKQQFKIVTAFNAIKKQFAEALTNDITEELLKNLEE